MPPASFPSAGSARPRRRYRPAARSPPGSAATGSPRRTARPRAARRMTGSARCGLTAPGHDKLSEMRGLRTIRPTRPRSTPPEATMPVSTDALIQHVSELPAYSPPAHSGTVNRRLVDREFGAGFEMILGQVAPGGDASRHYHVNEAQVVYILKGAADVALGDDAPPRCRPWTVMRI